MTNTTAHTIEVKHTVFLTDGTSRVYSTNRFPSLETAAVWVSQIAGDFIDAPDVERVETTLTVIA